LSTAPPSSLKQIFGRNVVDPSGSMIGRVSDVAFENQTKELRLMVETREKSTISIPWSDIQAVEDVVLLSKPIELPRGRPGEVRCPTCKTKVPENSRFCSVCGARIRP